jgi:hypothetical protein
MHASSKARETKLLYNKRMVIKNIYISQPVSTDTVTNKRPTYVWYKICTTLTELWSSVFTIREASFWVPVTAEPEYSFTHVHRTYQRKWRTENIFQYFHEKIGQIIRDKRDSESWWRSSRNRKSHIRFNSSLRQASTRRINKGRFKLVFSLIFFMPRPEAKHSPWL